MNNIRAIKHSTVWPVLVFMSLLAGTFFIDHLLTRQTILKDREIISSKVSEIAVGLSAVMNQRLQLTYSLSAFVKSKIDVTEDDFIKFANAIIGDATGIKSLQLAPNAVVTFLTNKKENAKAIGHDLLADPKRRPFVEAAIKERRYVIAGPIDLVQGGRAIIARNPIFLKTPDGSDYFWGFATILLDVDKILENTIFAEQQSNINFAIRGKDALGSNGEVFYGEPLVFESDPVVEKVVLPFGDWQVGAYRHGDIPGLQRMKINVWLIGFIFALISAWLIKKILIEPEVLGKAIQLATYDLQIAKSEAEKLFIQAKEANRALASTNKELESFTSIASHDLQEPLRKIVTLGDRLATLIPEANARGKDYLHRMQNSALRMRNLVEDLLQYTKIENNPRPFVPVDLNNVVENVLEDLETRISETQGAVNFINLPIIEGDPIQIHQLFLNLIGNALKFHKEGIPPVVNLKKTKMDNGYWEISVEDNGIGIDAEHVDKIFKPFERLHGKTAYEGTGIGLTICNKIVSRHGGKITVKRQSSNGATVHIILPEKQNNGEVI